MAVAKVINGEIVEGPMMCPKSLRTEDGRVILGFDKMSVEQHKLFNYYPVEYPQASPYQRYGEKYFDGDKVTFHLDYIPIEQIKEQMHD